MALRRIGLANIVVCADGTWNRPEEDLRNDHPTNVLKLARGVSPRDGEDKQHVFYGWRLGSYHDGVRAGVAERDIHFVGVWDTVGALGIPFSFMGLFDGNDEFYDNRMGSNIGIGRHALAIDERREDFAPTLWQPRPGVDLKQVWFAGCHGDIGGGHPLDADDSRIADVALGWMLNEAGTAGLVLEPHLPGGLTDGRLARIHRSRVKAFRVRPAHDRSLHHPDVPTSVHPSVRDRFEGDASYRSKNLVNLLESHGGWDEVVGA